MKFRIWVTAAACIWLAGCQSKDSYLEPSKPVDKMSHDELCAFYGHYRDDPALSQHSKDVATNQMRAKGCPTS